MAESSEKCIVLIAMDGSEPSNYAFRSLGASFEGESMHAIVAETDQRETTFLDMLSTKLKEERIGGKVKTVTGKPGEAICQVAKDEKVSFIVSGTRGRRVVKRALSGSVSDYILHNARVPVIIVPVKKEK